MTAYYNENDPKAAAWLRELIRQGHIAPGDVDERSIADVRPVDLLGYTQCHFFAGIGVWSYALRRAGWSDDRPIWTGSCPCQPFSAAGKSGGFDDERHLWPHFHWLIDQCRPDEVLGEQVASKDGLAWLDLVQSDLEGTGYASGALDFCSAGVGAPHIRQRLYWFGKRLEHAESDGRLERRSEPSGRGFIGGRGIGGLADTFDTGSQGRLPWRQNTERPDFYGHLGRSSTTGGLADADGRDSGAERQQRSWKHGQRQEDRGIGGMAYTAEPGRQPRRWLAEPGDGRGPPRLEPGRLRDVGGMGNASSSTGEWNAGTFFGTKEGVHGAGLGVNGRLPDGFEYASASLGGLADANVVNDDGSRSGSSHNGRKFGFEDALLGSERLFRPSPINGFWRDADWIFCRDGKWRPIESGTFPLAHGSTARMVRLRGYGNAINAEAATVFIEAYLEAEDDVAGHLRLTEMSDLTNDNRGIFG